MPNEILYPSISAWVNMGNFSGLTSCFASARRGCRKRPSEEGAEAADGEAREAGDGGEAADAAAAAPEGPGEDEAEEGAPRRRQPHPRCNEKEESWRWRRRAAVKEAGDIRRMD